MPKFRTTGHDIAPKAKPVIPPKIGEPPPGKLGIYNSAGQRVGHIGPKAGPGAVSRFTGTTDVSLTKIDGRPAWKQNVGPTSGRNANKAAAAADAKVKQSLRTAKGSVSK